MIQVTPKDKIFVATQAIDFRCGIDTLAGHIKTIFLEDPFSGAFFCFANRSLTAFKILVYDQQGYWLLHKRFSKGKMPWWPKFDGTHGNIDPKNFLLLIYGGDGEKVRFKDNWKEAEDRRVSPFKIRGT